MERTKEVPITISTIINVIENLNEPWGLKDTHSRHLYMNKMARLYTHTPKKFDIEGKTDAEFPTSWSEFADDFILHDHLAEKSNTSVPVIETDFWYGKNEMEPYLSEKIPVHDQSGSVVGIMWNAKPVMILSPLVCIGVKMPGILHTSVNVKMFTYAEMDIIFLLIKRLSRKEIAKILNIAVQTTANRINTIYKKANVHSLIQFEEYCKYNGLDNYIPCSLMNKGIRFI